MWALVEVQRRFGGMAPRAVVGGEFVVDAGTEAVFEVLVGADYDSLVEHGRQSGSAVASRIYDDWPFMAGASCGVRRVGAQQASRRRLLWSDREV